MDKLKMHSPDLTQQNIDKLLELFPNCKTEKEDSDGKLSIAVDFDLLKQELSKNIVEGPKERYQLNWPGKKEALLTANAPIAKTLRPCREESVDFDNTENLFIEGDNLDALKLLQETYLGKVKMIYIDPPYNTGKDFIYADNFSEATDEYLKESGQKNENGCQLVSNTDSNGRFHSDWLSMMYSRLKLARNLLQDDGVIFISIDDNEHSNLLKITNEIFGEDNFVSNFVWEKRLNRENRKEVSYRHDNILCFVKNRGIEKSIYQLPMNEKALSNYKNPDNDPRGLWKSDPAHAQAGHGTKSQFYDLVSPSGIIHKLESGRCWLYTQEVMNNAISDGRIWFGKDGKGVPRIKTYLHAKERGLTPESVIFAKDAGTNESAKNHLKSLFNGIAPFDTPKPVELLKHLLLLANKDGIVLDFFAGAGTMAHAAMNLNAEDSGTRKFIMVQLPEECSEKSEAFKAGYKTVAEISKERIRRAGKKITEENPESTNLDTGFRVLKIDSSNMNEVHYTPDSVAKDDLFNQVEHIKSDRTSEDLLFQVMLDWGVDLSLPIRKEAIEGKEVYFVNDDDLIACFDKGIDGPLINALAAKEPLRVVFRDDGFASDSIKINVEQIFKQMAPATDIKAI
jgi:adenine-specific DNA-methyltransferase